MARRAIVQEQVVDVVEALPELRDAIPAERLEAARSAVLARSVLLRPGRWDAGRDAQLTDGGPGFLVVEGVLVRCVNAAHRTAAELLGPGDLLRPHHDLATDLEPPFGSYWRAITEVRLAVLDGRFVRAATAVPETTPALIAATTRRTIAVSRQLVIVQAQSVEARILATLRHLAERWGHVTPDGIVLPAFLSHGTLALLLGARRPSVTSAMVRLAAQGLLTRQEDGRWLLPSDRGQNVAAA